MLEDLLTEKCSQRKLYTISNEDNPARCLVNLYQKYIQHGPKERKTTEFYLKPLKKPKDEVWYSNTPVGHNPLSQTVKRLCETAGISGYKTNYSLRVTSATRLFKNGLDEQLIMSRTGHLSLEGVRTYKRICEEQERETSHVLNSATN